QRASEGYTLLALAGSAGQQVADLGEQTDLVARGLRLRLEAPLAALGELVHRQHDEEIDRRRGEQEGDQRVDEARPGQHLRADLEALGARDTDAARQLDERLEEPLRERGHYAVESGADDDGDGKLDDVAARDEIPETLQHGRHLKASGR